MGNYPGPRCCSSARSFLYDASTGTARRIFDDTTSSQSATQLNDAGQIAAALFTDATATSPSKEKGIRLENGSETAIGALPNGGGVGTSSALAINRQGWIAGWSVSAAGLQRAVMWDGSTLHDLGAGRDGTSSVAFAINDLGQAVGATTFGQSLAPDAALFVDGTIRDLGSVGGRGSIARALNDAGRIVGNSLALDGAEHAFVYDLPAGPMRDVSPGAGCELVAVNSGGVAVGFCAGPPLPDGTTWRAAILRGPIVENLDQIVAAPEWVLVSASGINDAGQIVGRGLHRGEMHGFMLTPR